MTLRHLRLVTVRTRPMSWRPSCLRVASVLPVGLPATENDGGRQTDGDARRRRPPMCRVSDSRVGAATVRSERCSLAAITPRLLQSEEPIYRGHAIVASGFEWSRRLQVSKARERIGV